MRGRTFLNKFVIIDEAQNLTPKQMKTLITRAGPGTKIVCLGNLAQIDTPYLTEGSVGPDLRGRPLQGLGALGPRDAGARRALAPGRLRERGALAADGASRRAVRVGTRLQPSGRGRRRTPSSSSRGRGTPAPARAAAAAGPAPAPCADSARRRSGRAGRPRTPCAGRARRPGSTGSRSSRPRSRRRCGRSRPGNCVPGDVAERRRSFHPAHSAIGSGASSP